MTVGAPAADLKAGVLARIDERGTSAWPRRLAWIAVPIAAAAAIFLIVFLRQDQNANRTAEHLTQAGPAAPIPDRPAPPTPPQQTVEAMARTDAAAARTSVERTAVATLRSFRTPSEVETMAPPRIEVPSMVVPSLALRDITTTPIGVEPLETIAPIALSPIGEGDRQ
jgi:hypothetical protein